MRYVTKIVLLRFFFFFILTRIDFTTTLGNHFEMERGSIRDIQPSTSFLRRNNYHINAQLFVLDVVRIFQDHPKFSKGLKENHIVEMLEKESFACGDIEAQVRNALKELINSGFIRYVNEGYRTLGPFAKLGLARTPRQLNMTWDRLCEMQKFSTTSLNSSVSSRSQQS